MFQFPRFPPPPVRCAVLKHDPEGVAPFGYLWITSCQHFPRAFRRVAASFIGCRRQGIHRLPLFADFSACDIAPPSPTRASSTRQVPSTRFRTSCVLGLFFVCVRSNQDASRVTIPPSRVSCADTRARARRVCQSPRHQVVPLPHLSRYRQHDARTPAQPVPHSPRPVEPRGFEPRTSAMQRRRSPS